ncbi:MAG TPA: beta-galactosidase, partial [Tichowtungia sp.]|nr:beta-galactosidase [Tichowtungia sp.]
MKKITFGLMALMISMSALAELPSLKRVGDKWLLHVDGKPFPMLSGHVMNSSSFDLEAMESVWDRMKAFGLNTLICPVSWQAIEPAEGQYDFTLVDGLIRQARERDMKLILPWFGTWKNARSFYVPEYVISDMERFPRMQRKDGQKMEYISTFSTEARDADTRAFAAMMRHIKEVDGDENTVIMVQIQNEVGVLGDSRDRSPMAEAAFAGPVPQELIDYMVSNRDHLKEHLKTIWAVNGYKTAGTWGEVFGNDLHADEIFMAWQYSNYIDHMAAAGKAEHNIPMFVNGWLGQTKYSKPGRIPSGGPVARMMDVWKAGAPHIDLLAADIYAYFKYRCEGFIRDDNPLFVPEACALWLGDRWSGPAKAFYTIAEAQGIGFAPFGIDHAQQYDADHPIGVAYGALNNLMPLILENFGTENLRGFYKAIEEGEPEETETSLEIGP